MKSHSAGFVLLRLPLASASGLFQGSIFHAMWESQKDSRERKKLVSFILFGLLWESRFQIKKGNMAPFENEGSGTR